MPTLIKYCKPEHNVLDRCHTIRLGTFEYYRKLDPSFAIADATEAAESTSVFSLDTEKASPEAMASVMPLKLGSHSQMRNCSVSRIFPNCFLWCCSQLPEAIATPDYGTRFDPDYTSSYTIPDANQFAEHVAFLLNSHITSAAFGTDAREMINRLSVTDLRAINLVVFHRKVEYTDNKHSAIEDSVLRTYCPEIPLPLRPVFVKPNTYAADHEYRFVFLFQHMRLGALPVKKDPVDVPVLPIAATNTGGT